MTDSVVQRLDGVSIAVTDLGGDGPVVVLLHGSCYAVEHSRRVVLPIHAGLGSLSSPGVGVRALGLHGEPLTSRSSVGEEFCVEFDDVQRS